MLHLDLFSGIGGFALAVDTVWSDVEHIFCEIDPYCQALLKLRWKGAKIYGDIRTLIADTKPRLYKQSEKQIQAGRITSISCDLLTGGFPCQPFSHAGKRRGTNDNRYLWPEMLRVIQLTKPAWVVVENVRGLLSIKQGVVFEQVCSDLESKGYAVQAFVIPAVAVNAPHRRDRVWIVAMHTPSNGCWEAKTASLEKGHAKKLRNFRKLERRPKRPYCNDTDTAGERLQGGKQTNRSQRTKPDDKFLYGRNRKWDRNWLKVATELCGMDDGLPVELDGFKLSKPRHRVERLKALGNAIVPQVALEIFEAIKKSRREDGQIRNSSFYLP